MCENWAIDSTYGRPSEDTFAFVPIQVEEAHSKYEPVKTWSVAWGLVVVGKKPLGKLRAVVNLNGEIDAGAFYEQFREEIDKLAAEVNDGK